MMGLVAILVGLMCLGQVLCNPIVHATNKSDNVHDKRSIGSLIMPLLTGLGDSGGGGGGGGMLSLLGSLFTNQLTGGGGGGGRGGGHRPMNDHFGAASSSNSFGGPAGNQQQMASSNQDGPGIGFNLDLGRIGSNIINGFNSGQKFGSTGGALLGSFLQSGTPVGRPQQRPEFFRNNNFQPGMQEQPRGSGSSFRNGNSLPPPPQSFQDEMPRDFHSRTRTNFNMPSSFPEQPPPPPPPPPPPQPHQQVDFTNHPSSSGNQQNDFSSLQNQNFAGFQNPSQQQQQQILSNDHQQQMFNNDQQQQMFNNNNQQQQHNEQLSQFEENVSAVAQEPRSKSKPNNGERKKKPSKNHVAAETVNFNNAAASTGSQGITSQSNSPSSGVVSGSTGVGQSFFDQSSGFPLSSSSSQLQNQQQQENFFQLHQANPNMFGVANDNTAFASDNVNQQQFVPNNDQRNFRPQSGPNYAHSVPSSFDNYGDRIHPMDDEAWLTEDDQVSEEDAQ